MTQSDFGNIDPDTTSGTDLSESILEPWRDALHSCHKGSSRPSYAGQGLMWIDDSATPWLIKVYTGSTDCIIGSIAPSTGVFNVRSDVISEASSGTGVTVDGVLLKDGAVTTDTINEKTADAGVTIDGVLLKDGGGAAAMTSAGGNFPNVDADVTATDEDMNSVLTPYATARVELGGHYDAGQEVVCERIGNTVTITMAGGGSGLTHESTNDARSPDGVIPSQFRPHDDVLDLFQSFSPLGAVYVTGSGRFGVAYFDSDGVSVVETETGNNATLSYVIANNIT